MNQSNILNQAELAEHWLISESTLDRWRSEVAGPVFLKLHGHVRYRLSDIVAFEDRCLRKSTSEHLNTSNNWR